MQKRVVILNYVVKNENRGNLLSLDWRRGLQRNESMFLRETWDKTLSSFASSTIKMLRSTQKRDVSLMISMRRKKNLKSLNFLMNFHYLLFEIRTEASLLLYVLRAALLTNPSLMTEFKSDLSREGEKILTLPLKKALLMECKRTEREEEKLRKVFTIKL